MSAHRRLTPAVADVLLLLCAAIWGVGFYWQKWATNSVGPMTFVGLRCLLGGLVVLPLLLRRRTRQPRGSRSALLVGGLLTGVCLLAGSVLQQIGMQTATMTNGGFITSLYVVLVPFFGLLVGQPVTMHAGGAVALAAIGLYELSFRGGDTFALHEGDLYVLASTVTWALHVQIVGWASRRSDPIALSVLQFFVAGFLATCAALAVESPTFAAVQAAAVPIALSGILATGVAFTFQVVAQDVTAPTHAAILLSLESVFSAVVGVFWAGEDFGVHQALGAAAMLAAVLVAQWPALRRPRSTD